MFNVSNYSPKSKYYDDSNKLVVGKIQDEAGDVTRFVGLKPNMYCFLVDDSSEHKRAKIVKTTSHNKYKDILFNKKCFRNSINRFQSKDHKT